MRAVGATVANLKSPGKALEEPSINSPPAAAMANLDGIEGMEPLKGASWGREGVVSGAAMAVRAGGKRGGIPSTCCGVAVGG